MSKLTYQKRLKQISKSIVLTILYLCFANVAYAQGRCQYRFSSDVDFLGGIMVLNSTKKPITGVVCTYYSKNGNVLAETPFKNGKKEGIEKQYHENGKLSVENPFKNGIAEGIQKVYFESGKLWMENPYKNGILDGIAKDYDEKTGILRRTVTYIAGKRL